MMPGIYYHVVVKPTEFGERVASAFINVQVFLGFAAMKTLLMY